MFSMENLPGSCGKDDSFFEHFCTLKSLEQDHSSLRGLHKALITKYGTEDSGEATTMMVTDIRNAR
jgi:hypothetical protein